MKPNVKFLISVREQNVYEWCEFTSRHGMRWGMSGGEVTAKRHVEAGYVAAPQRGPRLGRTAYYTLTAAGRAAIIVPDGKEGKS